MRIQKRNVARLMGKNGNDHLLFKHTFMELHKRQF